MGKRRYGDLLDNDDYPYTTGGSSSSYTIPEAYLPTPKPKRKKMAKETESKEEKRLFKFKPTCPQAIQERVDRVMSQRFYMVDRNRFDGELKEEFKVLGSTGNIYTVTIEHVPSCDCPDASKGNHCKHILFIFLKVLSVPYTSHIWYQKALLTPELEVIFQGAPLNPMSLAPDQIRELYANATGQSSPPKDNETDEEARKPVEDDCPICSEDMKDELETRLVFCDVCKNATHSECFLQWSNTARARGQRPTCVFCRSSWAQVPGGKSVTRGKVEFSEEGYINMAAAAGISTERDTSSYPRWYNYRRY